MNAIANGIIVAVYIRRIPNTIFQIALGFPSGWNMQKGVFIFTGTSIVDPSF